MINVVFLNEFLHTRVVKFFSFIGLKIFRASFIVSNNLCDRFGHFVFALTLERYGPRILAQHIDNCKYVFMTLVKSRVRTHVDHVRLPQIVITAYNDASSWKIFSRRSM